MLTMSWRAMREVLKVEVGPCLHTHYRRSELQRDCAELRGELGGTDEFCCANLSFKGFDRNSIFFLNYAAVKSRFAVARLTNCLLSASS